MIQIKTTGGGMPHHAMIPNAQAERDKPESVIRPHLLRFVIPSCFLACFSPLAGICAVITSRRSPLRLR